MPNLDQKGPGGLGPKTGKKLGKCRKNDLEIKTIEKIYFFKKEPLSNSKPIKQLHTIIKKK
ncbi:DUF5320 domain-containing protein [Aureibaculum sp. A20]|uniref:DUF5320 domain-containing protein n=1 Tax=Aureibaculum flavum TaxID=2795986 RepID=A0ABS0WUP7_9FLAO|nr:DUF5320 domain-containing protein [Aureibaculum flavum]